MSVSTYAIAVEIEKDLFEIFDILTFDTGTEREVRYRDAVALGATGVFKNIRKGIKIGATLDNDVLINESEEGAITLEDNENAYFLISNNKVFACMIHQKDKEFDKKYAAAFESNVIVIDISLEDNVGFGDLWDGNKIIRVE